MLPNDCPAWAAVFQQTRRWLGAGCFADMVHDLGALLRLSEGRKRQPTAVILDSKTAPSTPESGARAGYDGNKRRKGSKLHLAVDTLSHLLARHVTPADAQDRAQVATLVEAVQDATGERVGVAFVDQGPYRGRRGRSSPSARLPPGGGAPAQGQAGVLLLPRRWVVERSFAWVARFRRLVRNYELLPDTVAGLHFIAVACLVLHHLVTVVANSP